MRNVIITPDLDGNWLAWGQLVLSWANPANPRPTTVLELKQAMQDNGVQGTVEGSDARAVNIMTYDGTGAIIIPVPTQAMIDVDIARLSAVAAAPYPLPSFYSTIFGGTPPVVLNLAQRKDMATRRLGEYVINECM